MEADCPGCMTPQITFCGANWKGPPRRTGLFALRAKQGEQPRQYRRLEAFVRYEFKNFKFRISNAGFTLVELLVVISIIGVLLGLAVFGLTGARESARDTKRKSDLEAIRSGLELFKADCKKYPTNDIFALESLTGDDSLASCLTANTYISQIPQDPQIPARNYRYSSDGITYQICAALEGGEITVDCGGATNCGSSRCNYKAVNP